MDFELNSILDLDLSEPQPAPEKRCYTIDEIMGILDISRNTAYNLIHQNLFHAFKIGKREWRISKKSFDQWLDRTCS